MTITVRLITSQPCFNTNEDPTTQVEQLRMQLTDLHVQLGYKKRGLAEDALCCSGVASISDVHTMP